MDTLNNPLTKLWLERLQSGGHITVKDLYRFSKIKLRKKRARKKFEKYYNRYVSTKIVETFWGCLLSTPLLRATVWDAEKMLSVEPIDGPVGKLYYFDRPEENVFPEKT